MKKSCFLLNFVNMMENNRILTNATVALVASLDTRKGRRKTGLLKAEGTKCVLDTYSYFEAEALYATSDWIEAHPDMAAAATEARRGELGRMSSLVTAPDVIAVYRIPPEGPLPLPKAGSSLRSTPSGIPATSAPSSVWPTGSESPTSSVLMRPPRATARR